MKLSEIVKYGNCLILGKGYLRKGGDLDLQIWLFALITFSSFAVYSMLNKPMSQRPSNHPLKLLLHFSLPT